MIRHVGSTYLWLSPLAFIVLGVLYHYVSLWAGIAGGAVHVVLVVVGLHARGAFEGGGEVSVIPGLALLVIGGAVVWAAGPSGPPTPENIAVSAYNNAGLTLGFLITLLGFATIAPALPPTRDRALAWVGLICFTLMFVLWLLQSALGLVLYDSPLIHLKSAEQPEWFQVMRNLGASLGWRIFPGGYLAGAAFVEMAIRFGWVRPGLGRLMFVYCALGVLAGPMLRTLLTPSAVKSMRAAFLFLPYLPPAMMCLVPYYIGVLGLCNATKVSR